MRAEQLHGHSVPPDLLGGGLEQHARALIVDEMHGGQLLHAYKSVCLRVDISIMVIGDASDIIRNDRKTPEISNAPVHMKQDTTSIEYLNLMP